MQSIDANINEESSVRYYAKVPRPAATEEWLLAIQRQPTRNPKADDEKPAH